MKINQLQMMMTSNLQATLILTQVMTMIAIRACWRQAVRWNSLPDLTIKKCRLMEYQKKREAKNFQKPKSKSKNKTN